MKLLDYFFSPGGYMRQKRNRPRSIFEVLGKNPGPKELEQMSLVLEANPEILDFAFSDLTRGRRTDTGRKGMTAEQVLRCAVLKQLQELTCDDLEFWLADSYSLRSFTKLRQDQCPSISTLQSNIKSLREETWMAIHQFSNRGYQVHHLFDQWQQDGCHFVCRIKEATNQNVIEEYPVQEDSHVFFDARYCLERQTLIKPKRPFILLVILLMANPIG